MKSGTDQKSFDVVNWLRATRDRIYEETKHMTPEELRVWYSQRPTDPILAKLFDRRKVPGSGTDVRRVGPTGEVDQ